jgi:hypothetical protein
MKLGMYITACEPILTAYFINPSHQSLCLYVYPTLLNFWTPEPIFMKLGIIKRIWFEAVYTTINSGNIQDRHYRVNICFILLLMTSLHVTTLT